MRDKDAVIIASYRLLSLAHSQNWMIYSEPRSTWIEELNAQSDSLDPLDYCKFGSANCNWRRS
jgi:hypothetical protein